MTLRNYAPSSENKISTVVIADDEDISTSSLQALVEFINNDEVPVVDLEAVLDVLFGSIQEVCLDYIDPKDVVHWIVTETCDFKAEQNRQTLETLECLLLSYLDNIVNYLKIVGIIKNGRLPYTFTRLSPGCAVVLQRTNNAD